MFAVFFELFAWAMILAPFCLVGMATQSAPKARRLTRAPRRKNVSLGFQRVTADCVHYSDSINYRVEGAKPHVSGIKSGKKSLADVFKQNFENGLDVWDSAYPGVGMLWSNFVKIGPKGIVKAVKQELTEAQLPEPSIIGTVGHCRWLDLGVLGELSEMTMPIVVKAYATWSDVIAELGSSNEGDKDTFASTSMLSRWNLVYRAIESGMVFANRSDFRVQLGFGNGPQQSSLAALTIADSIGLEDFHNRVNMVPDKETGTKHYVSGGYIPLSRFRFNEITNLANEERGIAAGPMRFVVNAWANGEEYDRAEAKAAAESYIASLFDESNRAPKSASGADFAKYLKLPKGSLGYQLATAVKHGSEKLSAFMLEHNALMRSAIKALDVDEPAKPATGEARKTRRNNRAAAKAKAKARA